MNEIRHRNDLIEFMEVMKVIDEGFSESFDQVTHSRPIQKITMHGIHSDLVIQIQNWFSQSVVVDGHYSIWRRDVYCQM